MIFETDPRFYYDPEINIETKMAWVLAQIDTAVKSGHEVHVYDFEDLDDENQFGLTYMVEPRYAGTDALKAKDAALETIPYVEIVGTHGDEGDFPSAVGQKYLIGVAML